MQWAAYSSNGARAAIGARIAPGLQRRFDDLLIEAFRRWRNINFRRFASDEVNLTASLVGQMIGVVREWRMPVTIRPETGEYSKDILEGRIDARTASRVDISISGGLWPYDIHYIIECKRLGRGATASQYVEEGMLRFVSGRYSSESAAGAMVGYVLTGTLDTWRVRVNAAVIASPKLTAADQLSALREEPGEALLLDSRHVRPLMPAIDLRHYFFSMTAI